MPNKYLVLAAVVLLSVVLRTINLGDHGIGGDEKNATFVSQFVPMGGANQQDVFYKPNDPYFTPQDFWKPKTIKDFYDAGARVDNGSSAMHAFLLHYWSQWFGLADATSRGLSVLFGVLLVVLLYFFVNRHFNNANLALGVAALAAVEPLYVGWSETVRTYTMTFFFCLLATHLFLILIADSATQKKPSNWLYFWYGICAFASLMCHYSVFTLFLLHGLLVVLFVRKPQTWLALALAMCIPALGMYWWLWHAGGQYAFRFMADSARVYNDMAAKNPQLGYLAPTTVRSALVQMWPIVGNHFLPTNGLFDALEGKKNLILSLLCALTSVAAYRWIPNERAKKVIVFAAFGISAVLYQSAQYRFVGLSVAIILFVLFLRDAFDPANKLRRNYLIVLILATVPLCFLVVFASQDQNTFRIQHKYVGYSMAFALVLVGLAIKKMWRYPNWVRLPMAAVLVVQLAYVGQTLQTIWGDTAVRYTLFATPRVPNPYVKLARAIVQKYADGDTILYPSYQGDDFAYTVEAATFSTIDAQLTNFYLPKNARFIQRIDRREPNKVVLKKANGQQQILFDFKGRTYRY